jgi:aspartate aminotransferase-like enzyme
LNLNAWRERARDWADWHPTLTTMAVNTFRALRAAIDGAISEGMERRWQRHIAVSRMIRESARRMGVVPLAPEEAAAPTVTTLILPDGCTAAAARRFVADAHGIMIAGANVAAADRAVRVGHMGPGATAENGIQVLIALEDYLRSQGMEGPLGSCLRTLDPRLLAQGTASARAFETGMSVALDEREKEDG